MTPSTPTGCRGRRTSIKTLIGTPNHPSYPSNHAAISTAAGLVLAHFFPAERERMAKISAEAGMSRIYAGIHYRFDMDAGDEIGRKIAAVAIARHADMLAKRTQRLAAN
jgi:membrane-associated phospholipid phosphatase